MDLKFFYSAFAPKLNVMSKLIFDIYSFNIFFIRRHELLHLSIQHFVIDITYDLAPNIQPIISQTTTDLITDVRDWNVFVDFDDVLIVGQEVEDVGDGRRHPATTLIEKLVETFRTSWRRQTNQFLITFKFFFWFVSFGCFYLFYLLTFHLVSGARIRTHNLLIARAV